ncbi:MAG: nuclear transport factor 2 family protein [Gemmatimonadota bacterium]|nr:nuclear transport factor 2 family protein [Gemmatimonadota bacterium]MDH3368444.1 nuclear transport factor 2 family protein [Gemmatimonadota bacterium]MDH3479031.1 nuclear transport factor 2 family protein [Gemmatimonadota bacterium]MDH3569674.1 nuclear transport factor 2 family protein [Gemmatimonadota bacterium]MDH5549524.1 nuclear transport factor 2 family protein [Gemmatimonadota bacterium]
MTNDNAEQAVLDQERRSLDEWAKGNPIGFAENDAEDATYFDDIGAHRLLDGHTAMRTYMASLQGNIPPHEYDLVDPKVQLLGDVAVLTLRYEPRMPNGDPLPPWKATSVYHRRNGKWRRVHAHWSMVKDS